MNVHVPGQDVPVSLVKNYPIFTLFTTAFSGLRLVRLDNCLSRHFCTHRRLFDV